MGDKIHFVAALACLAASAALVGWPGRPGRARALAALAAAAAAFLLQCRFFYGYTVDDAYISLRYAQNVRDGFGLRFNPGEAVPLEGYTNFLMVLWEAALLGLPFDDARILHAVKLSGMAFGLGSLGAAAFLAAQAGGGLRGGLLAALLFASIPYLAFWAVGGLETQMFIFWILAGLAATIQELRSGKAHLLSMVLLTLAALTRPEGALFAAAILGLHFLRAFLGRAPLSLAARLRPILPGAAVFALLFGAYFLWRWDYHGYLLPNTFYAKSDGYGFGDLWRRLSRLSAFGHYLLPLVFFLPALRTLRPGGAATGCLVASLGLLSAAALASKTEWMPGFRYELPALAVLVVLAALLLGRFLDAKEGGKRPASAFPPVLGLSALVLYLAFPALDLQGSRRYTSRLNVAHAAIGNWMRAHAPKPVSVATFDMGAIPYLARAEEAIEISPLGLLSADITHRGYDVGRILDRRPAFFVLQKDPPDAMALIPAAPRFQEDYRKLFDVLFTEGLVLEVHARKSLELSPDALSEGERLADRSWKSLPGAEPCPGRP